MKNLLPYKRTATLLGNGKKRGMFQDVTVIEVIATKNTGIEVRPDGSMIIPFDGEMIATACQLIHTTASAMYFNLLKNGEIISIAWINTDVMEVGVINGTFDVKKGDVLQFEVGLRDTPSQKFELWDGAHSVYKVSVTEN